MSMFMAQAHRGFALGAKYGVLDGFRRFQTTTETPKMDETAMQGAIGIIIAVGGVLIALYIIAVVVGSISYAVTSGNIRLSPTWNTTITNQILVQSIINVLYLGEYRFSSTGYVQLSKRTTYCNYRRGNLDDRHWGLQRTGYLSPEPLTVQNLCRTLNIVATV